VTLPKSDNLPNIKGIVIERLSDLGNVTLLDPINYDELVFLMKISYLVLTDSGGIQEEAPSLGKPVLVLREVTERPEAVEFGTSKIVGTDPDKIYSEVSNLLSNPSLYQKMSKSINPYGDGKASVRIVDYILENKKSEFIINGKK